MNWFIINTQEYLSNRMLLNSINIIRQTENISGTNGDYGFQIYSLPNKPLRITDELIQQLSMKDKLDIISGLCKGIDSIHNYEPPLFHRNICPDAFYIFELRGKYKALLAKFDCTKDTSNSDFTVYNNVEKKAQNQKTNQYFAPEVLNADLGQGVDWEKADIYSLAKTCLFILTGKMAFDVENLSYLDNLELVDEVKIILTEMLSSKPDERPSLHELMKMLKNQ